MEVPEISNLASHIGRDHTSHVGVQKGAWISTTQHLWTKHSGQHDPNLHRLKAVAVKEVKHLIMIIILDMHHTHYSDLWSNTAHVQKHF